MPAVLRVVAMVLERVLELVSEKSTKLVQILVLWPNYGLSGGLMGQDARARGKAAMMLVLLAKDVVSLQINTGIGKS